jgi:hypothetical protein
MNSKRIKHLNKLKEDTNEQLNEIRKPIEDMRGEFNRDIESVKHTHTK